MKPKPKPYTAAQIRAVEIEIGGYLDDEFMNDSRRIAENALRAAFGLPRIKKDKP